MLSRASWLPIAEKLSLQPGRSRRVDHDCGGGRTLLLSRDDNKLKAYCFRCNDGDSTVVAEPLADRVARLARAQRADATALAPKAPPPDGERDPAKWPAAARLWFARAGLHSGDIGRLQARLDPSTGRVVLPLGGGYWQGRAVQPGQQPKYIAPYDVPKVYPKYGSADRITLTEDVLSAYKVGRVMEGWCMLGTSLPHDLFVLILRSGKGVNVWLDNDLPPAWTVNRGQVAASKVCKQLRAAGVDVRNIVTNKDPKLIPYDSIKELLS